MTQGFTIAPAEGKLGILLVGLGAVSTTTIAGVMAIRKGLAKPIGSLTQMGTIRLGKRTEGRSPTIQDFVPLAGLDDIVFGGWDIFEDNCYEAAKTAGVLEPALLDQVKAELEAIKPMPAVFDQQLRQAARRPERQEGQEQEGPRRAARSPTSGSSRRTTSCDRLVMVWCGSTEVYHDRERRRTSRWRRSRRALEASDPAIPSSMIYAYAAITRRHPVRERGAEPERRHPGAARAGRRRPARRSPART